jgi:hypothetical protein
MIWNTKGKTAALSASSWLQSKFHAIFCGVAHNLLLKVSFAVLQSRVASQ